MMNDISTPLGFVAPELLIKRVCASLHISKEEAVERFEETKKFLLLCSRNPSTMYSPSVKVDEVWHQFILFSRSYAEFCTLVGSFVHHEPSDGGDCESYFRTVAALKKLYGHIDSRYWAEEAEYAHCGHSDCGSSAH